MKFNEKEIAAKSHFKPQLEGRLNHKKVNPSSYYQAVFKERWFKLIDNCLFYFRLNDAGNIAEKEPSGVLILENASIQLEYGGETPFAFSISFIDEPEKRHMLSGMSELTVTQWVNMLRCASYEYLRSQLHILQSKIYIKTGMDPLLMVPRNEGSMKWAPGEPLPRELTQDMDTELHYPGHHTNVFRSKSSIAVFDKKSTQHILNTSTDSVSLRRNNTALERSKTTAHVFPGRHNPFNTGEFKENSPGSTSQHLRPAPSPPIRKKSSPKQAISSDTIGINQLPTNQGIFANNSESGLNLPPKPPSRKNSPRQTPVPSVMGDLSDSNVTSEDLIQF